ncbi:MAG TPA: hypothetical protein VN083_07970 [Vicinamibacteria bacterium]|jgi:hypothetical protein|nr:hypothetical protein [Vicinamibacteria bacterium]
MKTLMGVLAIALMAGGVHAQDAQDDDRANTPRPHIQVLQDPHEIASFYRSSQQGYGSSAGGIGDALASRYPIASFYRAHSPSPFGYSRFWTSGYGRRGFARTIGRNGDLFLFAPTFLAPMGPLAGAFFEAR